MSLYIAVAAAAGANTAFTVADPLVRVSSVYLLQCFRVHLPNQAPSYFHWAENKPVTTNQVYGFWQHDFPNQPHPERPPNFFADKRPFDVCGFPYPSSGKHEWDLTASHCRSPPLSQWRPTRRFCLAVCHIFHSLTSVGKGRGGEGKGRNGEGDRREKGGEKEGKGREGLLLREGGEKRKGDRGRKGEGKEEGPPQTVLQMTPLGAIHFCPRIGPICTKKITKCPNFT